MDFALRTKSLSLQLLETRLVGGGRNLGSVTPISSDQVVEGEAETHTMRHGPHHGNQNADQNEAAESPASRAENNKHDDDQQADEHTVTDHPQRPGVTWILLEAQVTDGTPLVQSEPFGENLPASTMRTRPPQTAKQGAAYGRPRCRFVRRCHLAVSYGPSSPSDQCSGGNLPSNFLTDLLICFSGFCGSLILFRVQALQTALPLSASLMPMINVPQR